MNLFHGILIGASIVSVCSTESETNHATSSLSYNRGDVSLSYKYDLIHLYTTSKPHRSLNQNHQINLPQKPQLVNHQNVQYAPLYFKPTEKYLNQQEQQESQKTELYTEANTSAFDAEINDEKNSELRQEQKRNLFPHLIVTESADAHPRKYIPGYNVDLQAVKNKLMQNGFYAINPNFLFKNKQVNVNYVQPQSTYHNEGDFKKIPQTSESKVKGVFPLKNQIPQDVKKYNKDTISGGQNEKGLFFYVKAPKVELNRARAHHIARTVHKAPVNVNSSFRKLPSLPHEFFSNPHVLQPSKPQLNPVHNSNVFNVRRTV